MVMLRVRPRLTNLLVGAIRSSGSSSNPPMAFPCMDALEQKSTSLRSGGNVKPQERKAVSSGPEPSYSRIQTGFDVFRCQEKFLCDHGGILPEFQVAYECWGKLNRDRSNAILLHTGLSASSHARSHGANETPGWWEQFIGAGKTLDTDKFFIICTNVIGGCYGSTGPSSLDPADQRPYAARFPIVTQQDMVRAQFRLLDYLQIDRLWASVGCSMGGMQSLAAGILGANKDRVGRIVSVSGAAKSHPYSIAMRHTQRQVLMADPNWQRGDYYDSIPPHVGMKLAREIATITYRSGPEWEQRFGTRRADPTKPPALCPDFLIETYLDHAGEKFCLEYDANSFLYISKAMDIFDLSASHQRHLDRLRQVNARNSSTVRPKPVPDSPYEEVEREDPPQSSSDVFKDLVQGLEPLRDTPVLVLGVQSDNLMPVSCQREIADGLREGGNNRVEYIELGMEQSLFGHDTFLIKRKGAEDILGSSIKMFLEEDFSS